jgi:mRNA-degrading endonuclease RelE of RelBE toxin-antitoxin system
LKHFTSPRFWSHYQELPAEIQKLADKNFQILKKNPRHKSLRLKKVGVFWSTRVGASFRAVAKERSEGLLWFWIGTHDEYELLISSKRR